MKAPRIENMLMWNETVYHLEPNSMRLFNEIMEMLGRIEPMQRNSDYKRIWLSEKRGTVADMHFDDIEDAMEYFEADNESDLNSKFLERYPDEKSWFLLESLHNEECWSISASAANTFSSSDSSPSSSAFTDAEIASSQRAPIVISSKLSFSS